MSWIKGSFVKIFGSSVILGVVIIFLVVLSTFSIGVATQYGIKVPEINSLISSQRVFYFGGFRNIWQYISSCAELDEDMIYQPRVGSCEFSNIEFKTQLSFDSEGRKHNIPFDTGAHAIAVLGDSHAMGWGVGDSETFSAKLQSLTERRVYNLGVSSYATERELDRLAAHAALDNIDTIIIQYCDNDLRSNLNYPIDREIAVTKFQQAMRAYGVKQNAPLANSLVGALKALMPQFVTGFNKFFVGGRPSIERRLPHRQSVERILTEYVEILQDKHVIVFFTSGHNKFKPNIENWVGSFTENGLNVDFIDLVLSEDDFFSIDDHLNMRGHNSIAQQINSNYLQ